MKKIVICLAITFLFGSVSFGYDNKTGYEQNAYVQGAYNNKTGYEQTPYNNNVSYIKEFIKGEKREQKVQRVRRDGSTVQAVVPVGTEEEKAE